VDEEELSVFLDSGYLDTDCMARVTARVRVGLSWSSNLLKITQT
jgi:hypothetical protein